MGEQGADLITRNSIHFLIQFNVPFKIISLIETSQSIGGANPLGHGGGPTRNLCFPFGGTFSYGRLRFCVVALTGPFIHLFRT